MFDLLDSTFGSVGELHFRRFMRSSHTSRWMIGADFVIGEPGAVHDVFAFTVFPYVDNFPATLSNITDVFPRDLKRTSIITDKMVNFLRDTRNFHFCFLFQKDRNAGISGEMARAAVARTMQTLQDLTSGGVAEVEERRLSYIKSFRLVEHESKARRFKSGNFFNIELLSVLLGTIMLWMVRHSHCDIIGIFPDRDKMTGGYKGVFGVLTRINHSNFCAKSGLRPVGDILGPSIELLEGNNLFYDPIIRIPDYIAGAFSRLDYNFKVIDSKKPKHGTLLEKFATDNTNILTIHVFDTAVPLRASTITLMSRTRQPSLVSTEELLEYAAAKVRGFLRPRRRSFKQDLLDVASARPHSARMFQLLMMGVAAGDPRCTAVFNGEASSMSF
ncbi:MAG: hypothetical protein ACRYFU_19040 [Janthinobacterium lividum]